MAASLKSLIFLRTLLSLALLTASKPKWTYQLTALDSESLTPDVITFDLRKTMVSRGIYKVSGQIDVKQDLTDDFHMEAEAFIGRTGSKDYIRTPFRIPRCTLSGFFNTYYKEIIMESVRNCSDHFPYLETDFEAPLTKRLITLDNCFTSNENMPSFMTPGYYRIFLRYSNQAQGWISFDAHIESDY